MNIYLKRILVALGLLIVYWGALNSYPEFMDTTLKLLGSLYVGFVIYDITAWMFPKSEEKK